jgi:autotransporter adhesin
MATGTAGTVARQFHTQQIHFLRKSIVFGDNGVALTVGVIPAGSIILKAASGVHVNVAFNAGTTNTLNVGTSADDDLYGTLLALGTTTFVALDEAVTYLVAADTTITTTVVLTGTAATTGQGEVYIAYIPDIDG